MMAAAMLSVTTSCSDDRDSNPVLNEKDLHLVLNVPGNSANNITDLENSDYLTLTTSQPEYGYPAPTTYTVSLSLDNDENAKWQDFPTTFTTARMQLNASEVNSFILDNAGTRDLSQPISLYAKVRCHLTGEPTIGLVESNVIEIKNVLSYVPTINISLPTTMHIVGSFAASDGWSKFVPLHFAYSADGFSYGIVYLATGDEFKINPDDGWKGNDKGFGQVTIGNNDANVVNGGDSETSNIKVNGESGWYTVVVKNKIVNNAIIYELNIYTAKVYLFGATAPGDQWSFSDGNLFTMSTSATEPCVSPTLAGDGELRLAVDCGIDWWKTEFTIKNDGTLYYRDIDIPSNWNDALGADFSFSGASGKQIVLDFTNGTGSMK